MPATLPDFMKAVSAKVGLEIQSDSSGTFSVALDDLPVEFLTDPNGHCLIRSTLCELPPEEEDAAKLMSEAMQAGLSRLSRQAEVLCLEEKPDRLVLYRRLNPARLREHDFIQALEEFLATRDAWTQWIQEHGPRPDSTSSALPSGALS